jgi:adenine phosphoribosyltransferase
LNVAEALCLIRDDGPPRADVTPLYANAMAFRATVDALLERTASLNWNVVAAVDSLGFVLGGAIAGRRGCGLVAVRKEGKLPHATLREPFEHYAGGVDALEVREDLFFERDRVLIVDEWIETGATVAAATHLVERCGAVVAGIATLHCDLPPDHAIFKGNPVIALNLT